MNRLELRVVLRLAFQIHLLKHVQSRLLAAGANTRLPLGFQGPGQLPAALTALEAEGLAVIARRDNLVLGGPDQAHEGQKLGGDADDGPGGLVGLAGVNDGDAAIVGREGQRVPAGREGHRVDPSGGVVHELSADGVEGEPLSPDARRRTTVDTLDEGREHPGVCIGRAGGEENGVRMPGDGGDGAADGLLQVLRDPPVVLLLEVTDGDDAVAGANSELGLARRPPDKGCGTGDSEEDEGRLVSVRGGLPD